MIHTDECINTYRATATPQESTDAHRHCDLGRDGRGPRFPADAVRHYAGLLAYETDCWDVHDALANGPADFVLLDVRSAQAYSAGHVDGAVSLAHRGLSETSLASFGPDTSFVVYCAGPHCNGADRAALRLAELGRPVKKMIGGVTGWLDEGFSLVPGPATTDEAVAP